MEFRVLGPVTAVHEGRVLGLGGPKQRLLFALLVAARGRAMTTGALIDGLWRDVPPGSARKAIQGYVHHLRGEIGDALVTEGSSYVLAVDDSAVDERRFVRAQTEAKPLITVDPVEASEMLTDALGLWRGAAYADFDGEHSLQADITRLEELRLVALGDRIDADLAVGNRTHELIGELESLTREFPLRESFRAQHMIALYRAGRQGEALRAFARTRQYLIEEMGIEPSTELQRLEEQILARDPDLDGSEPETTVATGPRAVRGYELRDIVAEGRAGTLYRGFQRSVGREVAIRVIGPARANDPEFIAHFQANTERVARVDHPNVVYVQDTWREADRAYQVMRWVEGGSLTERLRGGRLSLPAAITVLDQVGGALAHAHRRGVGHGAVSADNVLLASEGSAYLTDFVVGVADVPSEVADRAAFVSLARDCLVHDDTPSSVLAVLDVAVEDGYARVEDLLRALRQATGHDVVEFAAEAETVGLTVLRNPYKGLQAFQVVDAADFFGRDEVVDRLDTVLETQRLVAVVGPSGSGKSSVVKAGLAARLRREDRPVLVAEMYPGAFPFEELEGALRRVGVNERPISDELLADERGLLRTLKQILPPDDVELVLVIDQFEELFSMVAAEATRVLFLQALSAAVNDPRSRLRVVVTMRADFFDRPLRYPEFGALMEAGLVPLTMPGDEGLAAAIEGPAEAVGLRVEPGLTAQIVRDVADEPGGLPLLQYALTELFERREADVLTAEGYRRTGGVFGALGTRAEELYAEMSPSAQVACRQAVLRLVTVDEGSDDVRRRVSRRELAGLDVDAEGLSQALQLYGAHRLFTFDSDPVSRAPTVEVAHEALLREWDRLGHWIDSQRDDLVQRRRLDAAIQEWVEAGEEPEYLLTGGRLAQFDSWAAETSLVLTEGEHAYLETSRERAAVQARRSTLIRRLVMATLAVAAAVAVGFGFIARSQQQTAERQRSESETARMAAAAPVVARTDRNLGLLLALEGHNRDPSPDTLGALQQIFVDNPGFLGYMGLGTEYVDVDWLPDGRVLATRVTGIDVFDPHSASIVQTIDILGPRGLAVASDGVTVAVQIGLDAIEIYDLESGEAVGPRLQHTDRVLSVEWMPDGESLVTGTFGGTATVWDTATGDPAIPPIVAHSERETLTPFNPHFQDRAQIGVVDLAVNDDATLLGTVGGNHARVWDLSDGTMIFETLVTEIERDAASAVGFLETTDPRAARSVDFDGVEGTLIVATEDGVRRYRIDDGSLADVRDEVVTVVVNPFLPNIAVDNDFYVFGVESGRIEFLALGRDRWSTAGDVSLDTHLPGLPVVSVSPDRTRAVVGGPSGLSIWSLDGAGLARTTVDLPNPGVADVTASSDGRFVTIPPLIDSMTTERALLVDTHRDTSTPVGRDDSAGSFAWIGDDSLWVFAVGSDWSGLQEWSLDPLRPVGPRLETTSTFNVVLDRDDHFVATPTVDGALLVFDRQTGERLAVLDDRDTSGTVPLANARFSTDGSRLIAVRNDGAALVYDTTTWEEVIELSEGGGAVIQVAYSPSGDLLVTVSQDGLITFRDPDTFQPIGSPIVGTAGSGGVSLGPFFTTDGRHLVVTPEGEARIWDVATRRAVGGPFRSEFNGADPILSGGSWLVTYAQTKVELWDLDLDSWPAIACQAVGRNMTLDEWEQFGPSDEPYRPTCEQWPSATELLDEGETP